MKKIVIKYVWVPVYLIYGLFFFWQINYRFNQVFLAKDVQDSVGNYLKCMPALILLFFGILLYCNLLLNQKRVLILNSFISASVILLNEGMSSILTGTVLILFGVLLSLFEIYSNKKQAD